MMFAISTVIHGVYNVIIIFNGRNLGSKTTDSRDQNSLTSEVVWILKQYKNEYSIGVWLLIVPCTVLVCSCLVVLYHNTRRRPYIPKGHWSKGPLVRRVIGPKGHLVRILMFLLFSLTLYHRWWQFQNVTLLPQFLNECSKTFEVCCLLGTFIKVTCYIF